MNYPQNPKNAIKRSITSSFFEMSSSWKNSTASCALIRQTQNNMDFLHSGNKIQDLSPSDLKEFCSSQKMPQRSESTPVTFSLKKILDSVPKNLNLFPFLDNSPETLMANSIRLKDVPLCGSTSSLVEKIVSSGLSVHCPSVHVDVIQCSLSKEKLKEDDSMNKIRLASEEMNEDAVVESLDSKHVVVSEDEMDVDEDVVFTSSSGDEEEDDEDEEEDSDEDMTDEEEEDDDDWDIGDDRYVGKELSCTNQNVNESTTVAYFVSNSLSLDWNSGIEEEISNLSIINNSPGMQLDSDDDDDDGFESLLICEVNKKWESFYSVAAEKTESKSKQVSFACEESLITLHCWEDMEDSRKGLWNIDAQRFRRRIDECGKVLSRILQTDHRKKVFSSIHHFKGDRS